MCNIELLYSLKYNPNFQVPKAQLLVWTYLVRASNLVKFLKFFSRKSDSTIANVRSFVRLLS